ncbi:Uma2 family endonuclease [Spirulina subsalsa FACHB-351]|uniref:Uma2 family endonuclease n=1 Tax=Spirulina subsalsa FACHB-351 TaxID=234711 RepID=A0ABT3L3F0_9CYAN|nr:Uma2 family endonuclease [Spirulina subsalsa]MCW6035634.1 Uma2 family endonuclease [Spirulina subsalsa FACHB-351]
MIAALDPIPMPPQEYLEWEEKQPLKYEYLEGKVYAMTGGTIPHNDLAVNLTTLLKNHLRGRGCKVQMADAKVGISEQGPFHYPDVMVSCDERDRRATRVLYHPCLIIEVLSPSTEAFDRGRKFQNYRQIAELQEYILVSADQITVECFHRNDQGIWELYTYTEGESVAFRSVGWEGVITEIYEDVVLEGGQRDGRIQ